MPAFIFLELGIALLLVLLVWGWLYWHRPRDDADTNDPKGPLRPR